MLGKVSSMLSSGAEGRRPLELVEAGLAWRNTLGQNSKGVQNHPILVVVAQYRSRVGCILAWLRMSEYVV